MVRERKLPRYISPNEPLPSLRPSRYLSAIWVSIGDGIEEEFKLGFQMLNERGMSEFGGFKTSFQDGRMHEGTRVSSILSNFSSSLVRKRDKDLNKWKHLVLHHHHHHPLRLLLLLLLLLFMWERNRGGREGAMRGRERVPPQILEREYGRIFIFFKNGTKKKGNNNK